MSRHNGGSEAWGGCPPPQRGELLDKIFYDTERHAACLRWLSFLFTLVNDLLFFSVPVFVFVHYDNTGRWYLVKNANINATVIFTKVQLAFVRTYQPTLIRVFRQKKTAKIITMVTANISYLLVIGAFLCAGSLRHSVPIRKSCRSMQRELCQR